MRPEAGGLLHQAVGNTLQRVEITLGRIDVIPGRLARRIKHDERSRANRGVQAPEDLVFFGGVKACLQAKLILLELASQVVRPLLASLRSDPLRHEGKRNRDKLVRILLLKPIEKLEK